MKIRKASSTLSKIQKHFKSLKPKLIEIILDPHTKGSLMSTLTLGKNSNF